MFDDSSRLLTESNDPDGAQALKLMATNAAYAPASTPDSYLTADDRIRENALNAHNKISAIKDAGWVDPALGSDSAWAGKTTLTRHLDILVRILTRFADNTASYRQPFMAGLAARALINAYERVGYADQLSLLRRLADRLWTDMYDSSTQSLLYIVCAVVCEGGHYADKS